MTLNRIKSFFESNSYYFKELAVDYNDFLKHRSKTNSNDIDSFWSFLNSLILINNKEKTSNFYLKQKSIYSLMTFFSRKLEGKKSNHTYKLLNDFDVLQQIKDSNAYGLEMEFAVLFGDCNECNNIEKTRYSITEAMKNDFIPYDSCTRTRGCVCNFTLVPKTDKEGSLIKSQ